MSSEIENHQEATKPATAEKLDWFSELPPDGR